MAVEPLDALVNQVRECRECAAGFAATASKHEPNPVFQLDPRAQVLIAGQAPGARVHKSGRPFTDPSGVRLRAWLECDEATFYDPAKLAIVPMAFCYPGDDGKGGDLPPPKICAEIWRERMMAQLPRLKVILLVGQYAQQWHMPQARRSSLTSLVRAATEQNGEPLLVPMPHPSWRNNAWLKKNPWFEAETLPWLRAHTGPLLS